MIQFTDSVTKIKGSHNVMFDEIELSRVLVDLNVQSLPYIKMKIVHLSQVMVGTLHKFRFKLDSGAHGNLIPK